jgi:transcriptional regulator with XRE-family HTH domain
MKKESYLDNFILSLKQRLSQKGQLAETLTEILGIEKESVYRRLRGEVPFSATEIFKIATVFGISLDSIAGGLLPSNKPLFVNISDFIYPSEVDLKYLEEYPLMLRRLFTNQNAKSGYVGNIIPSSLCVEFPNIYKFYICKWMHQYRKDGAGKKLDDITVDERIKAINEDFLDAITLSPLTTYIFDTNIVKYFTEDMQFFRDIHLMTDKNIEALKEELHEQTNLVEAYAIKGANRYGNKVEVYVSNIHFDASFHFVASEDMKMTTMRSFAFSDAFSLDDDIYANVENWVNFMKHSSTMISGGHITERIDFFDRQRAFIDNL